MLRTPSGRLAARFSRRSSEPPMIWRSVRPLFAAVVLAVLLVPSARAQTFDSFYSGQYSFVDLGTPSGIPANLGGLTVMRGDTNTLIIGGAANGTSAALYSIGVTRDASQHITSFTGGSTYVAAANSPGGGIDGGLDYGPNGTLFYTSYSDNRIGQIKPGSAGPDKLINLTTLGITSSVGALQFVPTGFGGAGHLKIISYNSSEFYDATISADGTGTYDITNVTLKSNVGGAPESLIYVPQNSPNFANPSLLIGEYGTGNISSYEVDANGDPILSTKRNFLTGLNGVEGGVVDPLTGDFLFSTYGGGNRVIAVRGFLAPTPAPPGVVSFLIGAGITLVGTLRRRRLMA